MSREKPEGKVKIESIVSNPLPDPYTEIYGEKWRREVRRRPTTSNLFS
jgi:hypothetical protein